MTDWPASLVAPELTVVTTAGHACGVGRDILGVSAFSAATLGWPSANLAIFVPVYLEIALPAQILSWENGASVTGNIDVGIYDANGNRLVSAGSTAQSGTSTIQQVVVAATTLKPGTYYWAMAASSTSTLVRATPTAASSQWLRVCGVQQMASALPLPATATFAVASNSFCPFISVAGVATQ